MKKRFNKYYFFFVLLHVIFGGMACSERPISINNISTLYLDSVYAACKDVYLWNVSLPDVDKFGLIECVDPETILHKVRQYSPVFNGQYVDRWSFAISKKNWENLINGKAEGFGLDLSFVSDTDLRVCHVHHHSPAATVQINRGDRILNINGIDCISANETKLLSMLKQNVVELKVEKALDRTMPIKIMLTAKLYNQDIISDVKIIKTRIGNVGYFALHSFFGKETIGYLNDLFASFKKENVSELVIDLRYNGGGNGEIAFFLANSIAPFEARGKIFNTTLNNKKYSLLNYTLFYKHVSNGLSLKRVSFITSGQTASASEALINSLLAVMDVKLIGKKTKGKPFGYFPISVGNYYVLPVAFQNLNANGYGAYYDGLPINMNAEDDLSHALGDTLESCLEMALSELKGEHPKEGGLRSEYNVEKVRPFLSQERLEFMYFKKLND